MIGRRPVRKLVRALSIATLASPALLAVPSIRHGLESSMLLHMLVEFPLLVAAGYLAGLGISRAAPAVESAFGRANAYGLLSMTWLLGVSALWMVPAALDYALLHDGVAAIKVASWWLAGTFLALGRHQSTPAIVMFALGNLAWMCATAGLLYQSLDMQLCVSYLQDEQIWAGRGLVALSIAIVVWFVASWGLNQRA